MIAGIPKAAWKITKGLETLAKKNAKKAHLKRMAEKTLCGGIVYVQAHVSIKRDEPCENKENKRHPW